MAEIQEVTEALLELETELGSLKKTTELIGDARSSASEAVTAAEKVREGAAKLASSTEVFSGRVAAFVKRIEAVDFPTRLDKLDATVSGINAAVQNTIGRFDTVESHLNERIDGVGKKVEDRGSAVEERLESVVGDAATGLKGDISKKLEEVGAELKTVTANSRKELEKRLNWLLGLSAAGVIIALAGVILSLKR